MGGIGDEPHLCNGAFPKTLTKVACLALLQLEVISPLR